MKNLNLEQLINQQITNVRNGIVDKRVDSFTDFKNKYVILKSKITVTIELKEGITATIDVTDYFEKEIK